MADRKKSSQVPKRSDVNVSSFLCRGCLVAAWFCLAAMPQILDAQMIVAHRGASHDAPENTLAAFRMAWKQGADGIEGDFYLTGDGHIVCIHDDTTERTSGVNLEVSKSTLAELKQLDVGKWKDKRFVGERIPTLEEVIETVPVDKRIVIELKIGPEIIAPLQRVLKASKLKAQQILIISFDENTIAESKRLLPDIKAHWLCGYDCKNDDLTWTPNAQKVVQTVNRIKADGYGSEAKREVFNEDFIRSIKTSGVKEFHVWTVDDPANARFYQDQGAIGITTNRPDMMRRELEKEK